METGLRKNLKHKSFALGTIYEYVWESCALSVLTEHSNAAVGAKFHCSLAVTAFGVEEHVLRLKNCQFRHIARNITDYTAGLGTEIKMNIDINFSINEIHVLNIDMNFGITEIHVLNIDINFDISKFRF